MNLKSLFRASRQSKLALPCGCASVVLMALLCWPAVSSATCTNPNPNPNPNPQSFANPGDFNGDCKSDILWQNSGSGQNYIWLMNGAAMTSSGTPGGAASPWSVQGVGDFNGDGMADMLWRNSSTGQVYIWLMNGTALASVGTPGTISTNWSIAGVGDFNGDGKADILWQNSTTGEVYLWFMNGTALSSSASLGTVASVWNILGIGDFNGDGKADILWQNEATGQVYIWLMSGATVSSSGTPGTIPSVWSIEGIGDFDGNGKSDILWQNSSTGQIYIWLMNGAALSSSASPGTIPPPSSVACCSDIGNGWSIEGVGDYNGDGKADILWRNLTTGQTYIWLMNGGTLTSSASPGTVGAVWQIPTLAPYGCSNQVYCNILAETNKIRANGPFGTGNPTPSQTTGGALNPLVWDPGAAAVARGWAAQCNWSHNPNRDGGENNYAAEAESTPVTITGTDAVDDWASEVSSYVYPDSTECGGACGHYTQLVWRQTTGVGCAVQQCTTGSPGAPTFPDWAFVVCDYTPAGNYPQAPY